MEIREGRYYRDRIGHIHGPMERIDDGKIIWSKVGSWMNWYAEGKYLGENVKHDHDLIEEVTITPVKTESEEEKYVAFQVVDAHGAEVTIRAMAVDSIALSIQYSNSRPSFAYLDRQLTKMLTEQLQSWLDCSRFIRKEST